ncbi:hypothetical protein BLX87_19610 [Bacillus sp. VT-16-64]|nr:hypothetical protein BLX87_19610 [Bacillus sp. VT-16-64]
MVQLTFSRRWKEIPTERSFTLSVYPERVRVLVSDINDTHWGAGGITLEEKGMGSFVKGDFGPL